MLTVDHAVADRNQGSAGRLLEPVIASQMCQNIPECRTLFTPHTLGLGTMLWQQSE